MADKLVEALRILARDIVCEDGVATAVIEQASAEIARLREERRWIPVGESLPEKFDRVLLYDPTIPDFPRSNTHVVIGYFRGFDDWVSPWCCPDGRGPTHWQTLPTGPEGKEKWQ